jgi:hypothetical protein
MFISRYGLFRNPILFTNSSLKMAHSSQKKNKVVGTGGPLLHSQTSENKEFIIKKTKEKKEKEEIEKKKKFLEEEKIRTLKEERKKLKDQKSELSLVYRNDPNVNEENKKINLKINSLTEELRNIRKEHAPRKTDETKSPLSK